MTGLEKLKSIGAHKIFETTHIAKKYAQDILDENFSSMTKIQFAGFISILEREYGVDLQDLILAYGIVPIETQEPKKEPFIVTSAEEGTEKKSNKALYIGVAVAIVVLVIILNFSDSTQKVTGEEIKLKEEPITVVSELNNTTIQEAKNNLNTLDNTSLENIQGEVEPIVVEEIAAVEPIHTTKFLITPRSKLWIGIVDLDSFKRSQKLGSVPFELNPDKEWLLVMGHGFVDFEVNDEEKHFKDKNKVWFAYENGTLTKISRSEFKEKNRGKAW